MIYVARSYSSYSQPYLSKFNYVFLLHYFVEVYLAQYSVYICRVFRGVFLVDQDIVLIHYIFHKIHHLYQILRFLPFFFNLNYVNLKEPAVNSFHEVNRRNHYMKNHNKGAEMLFSTKRWNIKRSTSVGVYNFKKLCAYCCSFLIVFDLLFVDVIYT